MERVHKLNVADCEANVIRLDKTGRILLACPKCGEEYSKSFDELIALLVELKEKSLA